MPVSKRVRERIARDFPDAHADVERRVAEASDDERVQAAIVLWAGGDAARLADVLRLARIDWRDVLLRAELADEGWDAKLDCLLGPTR